MYITYKCRCAKCVRAKRIYEGHRLRGKRIIYFTDAKPAREHARFLLLNGWGSQTLARKIGVTRHTIFNLVNGKTKTLNVETANKILGTCTVDAQCGPGGKKAQWRQKVSAQ